MKRHYLLLFIFVFCLFPLLALPGVLPAQLQFGTEIPLKTQLRVYPDRVSPGQEAWIAATLSLDPGWYVYGNPKGPGPGLPTTLEVTSLPNGVTADSARFLPAEKLFEPELGPDVWVWVYRNETTVYLKLSTPKDLSPGTHQIHLRLKAGVCRKGLCVPYKTDLILPLTIVGATASKAEIPPLVTKDIERTHPGETKAKAQTTPPSLASIEKPSFQIQKIPELHPRPVHRSLEVGGFFKAALFALLAGFILNLMPCVLPVVSLKVLGFVQQAEDSGRRVTLLGLSFSAGILTVFLVLAALASFAGYGWGELFQKQSFLITMIALVFAMALCLFGVFQLPIPHLATSNGPIGAQRHGYVESFYKGTLATFLATPCSGPLLGGAMAWTLRQPPLQIFAVFSCLGVGMASPYVVMSFYPGALKWLPRPGNWLIHFERFMGFALMATVVYLLTIVAGNTRVWVVLFCLFLAIGLYVWGQMTTLSDSSRRRIVVRLAAVVIVLAGGWVSLKVIPSALQHQELSGDESLQWQPYSDEKLLAAAAQKRWVVVDFTADWCPNCILVERTALNNLHVKQAFNDHNALLLVADITRENPPAKRLLEKLGSRSIPFLALFPPGEDFWNPFFLRDLYRASDVLRVFSQGSG